jgi:hypothetical protein
MIGDFPAEIRNKHFPNTSLQRCHYTNLYVSYITRIPLKGMDVCVRLFCVYFCV